MSWLSSQLHLPMFIISNIQLILEDITEQRKTSNPIWLLQLLLAIMICRSAILNDLTYFPLTWPFGAKFELPELHQKLLWVVVNIIIYYSYLYFLLQRSGFKTNLFYSKCLNRLRWICAL